MNDTKCNLWSITALTLALALAAGCGNDTTAPPADDTTKATIGAAGGTLNRSGEASLEIPPGALSTDVDFTMDENSSPATIDTGRQFASPTFTIGPDGTQFGIPAMITIHYDEADLGGADESTVVIYTDDGAGWSPLATTVNESDNTASAEISHLSDYCATIPYGEAAQGVYVMLELVRAVSYVGFADVDIISARFDTIVDPCNVHFSLHPDSVYCNEYKLAWDSMISTYLDQNTEPEFLVLGENYEFEVFGNEDVPDLVQAINFPTVEPTVTNIINDQVLSLDGFTMEWTDTDASDVRINIISGGDQLTVVSIETANDGSHTFSADDLSDLTAGTHVLDLRHYTVDFITADGYDPNSTIGAGTTNITMINLSAGGGIGPDGGILPLGDDGYLDIPSGALSTEVDFTATVNSSPTPAPEGWAFMTPVYTIEPTGTTFAVDAELHFDYDEADLDGNDESSIVIFTDTGSGWVQIACEVYESMDYVEADIDHLSDFVAMVEVDIPAQGVYCELLVRRTMTYSDPLVLRAEYISARFDEAVSADPVTPLDADGVTFDIRDLMWDPGDENYFFMTMIPGEILTLGADYTFTIDGDDDVPDLTQVVTHISHEPYITNLATLDVVSTSGFDVEWGGDDGGLIHLTIYGEDDLVAFTVETENDGLYSITADDLAGVSVSIIGLELSCIRTGDIDEVGYDSNSFWKTCSEHYIAIYLED